MRCDVHLSTDSILPSTEHVMRHFAPRIQAAACADDLILACGVLTYAQEVLVPELLVMLIKEDLGIDSEAARQVLEKSAEIGELLNFDCDGIFS